MYTGIIKETAKIKEIGEANKIVELVIHSPDIARGVSVDESINVDGVCLTVVETPDDNTLRFQLVPETMRKTRMGELKIGDEVNVEKSMEFGDRIGGHFVMGHVDGVATVTSLRNEGDSRLLAFKPPKELMRFITYKGSITVNGVSLTVSEARQNTFEVALIPHTLNVTNLRDLRKGSKVNLEIDTVARYLAKLQLST